VAIEFFDEASPLALSVVSMACFTQIIIMSHYGERTCERRWGSSQRSSSGASRGRCHRWTGVDCLGELDFTGTIVRAGRSGGRSA
jgi:hypothetical protein